MSNFRVIENYKYYLKFQWSCFELYQSQSSPTFSVLGCDVIWKVSLSRNTHDSKFIQLNLYTESFSKDKIVNLFLLVELKNKNATANKIWIDLSFTRARESLGCKLNLNNSFSYSDFDDMLIIGHIFFKHEILPITSDVNVSTLQQDFGNFLKDQIMCDISFVFGNETVAAHKFVLCSRSEVFQKMFQSAMKESKTNSVAIKNIEKQIFEKFLRFLYTAELEDKTFETVLALYSVADQYCVQSLQTTCRDILKNTMTIKTIVHVLEASNQHYDDNLKDAASSFICEKFSEVEQTPEWDNLLDTNTRLASYVLRKVSKFQKKRLGY